MLTASSGASSDSSSRSPLLNSVRLLIAWKTPMQLSSTTSGTDSTLRAANMSTNRVISRGSPRASLVMYGWRVRKTWTALPVPDTGTWYSRITRLSCSPNAGSCSTSSSRSGSYNRNPPVSTFSSTLTVSISPASDCS